MFLPTFKVVFLVSFCFAVASFVLHGYYPEKITDLMQYKSMNSLTKFAHQIVYQIRNFDIFQLIMPQAPKKKRKSKEKLFTAETLRQFNGKEGSKGICIAILGRVYDVRKGKMHYGPGGGYEFFAGIDGSKAFITGDFSEEGLTDDVASLSNEDLLGFDNWVSFYDREYKYIGKLVGRYYNERGEATEYNINIQKNIGQAHSEKRKENQERLVFPPCNSEWSPDYGSRLWCTQLSGGIERDWIGVPRMLFMPGKKSSRCACIKNFGPPSHDPSRTIHMNRGDLDHPNLKTYPGCEENSVSCFYKN